MITLPGKTIQIYSPSGDPRGVRIAEITTAVPQAVVVPRGRLEEALGRPELGRVGVYFLFGPTENGEDDRVYIGEADDCGNRLKEHAALKPWWQFAVAIVSSKSAMTKGHGRLLEHWAIKQATEADRYFVENGTEPKKPPIPEAMEAECSDIFAVAATLLATVGFPVFEPLVAPKSASASSTAAKAAGSATEAERRFTIRGNGYFAEMIYTSDGCIVLPNSLARLDMAESVRESIATRREELVRNGVLVQEANGYRFQKPYAFRTPSGAANLIGGTSSNGWTAWVDKDGRTLDEVVRRPAERTADQGTY